MGDLAMQLNGFLKKETFKPIPGYAWWYVSFGRSVRLCLGASIQGANIPIELWEDIEKEPRVGGISPCESELENRRVTVDVQLHGNIPLVYWLRDNSPGKTNQFKYQYGDKSNCAKAIEHFYRNAFPISWR